MNKLGASEYIKNYLFVLGAHRVHLMGMVGLFAILSFMDVVGVGLIGPFMALLLDPTRFMRFPTLFGFLQNIGKYFNTTPIVVLGGILIVLFIAKGVFAFTLHKRILSFCFEFRSYLISRLVGSYLRMPYQFYLDRNSATLLQSVTHNTKVLTDDLLLPSLRCMSDGLVLVVIGLFLFIVSPVAMMILTTMFVATSIVYSRYVKPLVRQAGERTTLAGDRIISGVNQGALGIKEIRILRIEDQFLKYVSLAARDYAEAQTRFYSLLALPRYLIETVVVLFILVMSMMTFGVSGNGVDLVAMLAMFAAAGIRALPAMTQVSSSLASMHYSTFALNSISKDLVSVETGIYMEGAVSQSNTDCNEKLPLTFKSIELDGVSFSYPGAGRLAVTDVSLRIVRGASIGLIGESGSGKTTLVDILLGLHPVQTGSIKFNGVPIDEVGWNEWRTHIAYIPQTVFLIDDTLMRNVALGVEDSVIDQGRVHEAIERAQLSDFVRRLPNGLSTLVGERGSRLSGGEKQRIALARAFYNNRDVFVFDEATSALDAETEREVVRSIESLRGSKTVIVIAHRMSTIRSCDLIIRLEEGRLVSSGSFEQMIVPDML